MAAGQSWSTLGAIALLVVAVLIAVIWMIWLAAAIGTAKMVAEDERNAAGAKSSAGEERVSAPAADGSHFHREKGQ